MAADSYNLNGDVELARLRLERLVSTSVSWKQLAATIEQTAVDRQNHGDELGAQRLRQMVQALNLPESSAPEAAPAPSRGVEVWRVLLFIGAVLAFLVLIAIGLWYMALRSLKRQDALGNSQSIDGGNEPSGDASDAAIPGDASDDPPPLHSLNAYGSTRMNASQPFQPVEDLDTETGQTSPRPDFQAPASGLQGKAVAAKAQPKSPTVSIEDDAAGILGRYEAEYTFGTDDFDCSFTISTAEGNFLGDCGIGVADVLPAIGPQHVDALEVWLFDKGDVSSVSKILASEHAYEDPTLSNRLNAKGETLLAEPEALIVLETRSLRITAQVTVVEYDLSVDPNRSYFRRLAIEILAESADA
jgi:hypothetical protein